MATTNRLSWMIGGPQGSGVDSSARMFALACANGGLNVFGKREYYSNIKGEHSYFQIRVDERNIHSAIDDVHVLSCFEAETLLRHLYAGEVVKGGAVIYDAKDLEVEVEAIGTLEHSLAEEIMADLSERGKPLTVGSIVKDAEANGVKLMPIDYNKILEEIGNETGEKEFSKLQIVKNTIAVGASFGALGYELDAIIKTVDDIFATKSEKVKTMNRLAIEKGYHFIQKTYGPVEFQIKRAKNPPHGKRLFLQGTVAVGLGKIAAGCRYQTYYPITPATDESEFLESHPSGNVVVVQCEDEIAACAQAIGAALTGVRASTSTSGPGFCLMAEAQGWAGINEVPLVLVNYQRGGPSTGLPTRHEQGDLKFALNAGHGDFPRIVVAPGDLEESFYLTVDAFNWAEQYQMPVILISDKNLANNSGIINAYDLTKVKINRGKMLTEEQLVKITNEDYHFPRFLPQDDGVSERAVLGQKGGIHWLTGDEHTPQGHISEDPENRVQQMNKRMEKEITMSKQVPADKKFNLYGNPNAPTTIVSWGSNKGAILDAMERLKTEGIDCNFLHIKLLWPFPAKEVTDILTKAKTKIHVEMNYTAQLAHLIRQETGIKMDHFILKYNGRPMSEDELARGIRKIVKEGGNASKKEVLTHGV
jgi:2-oxoglutarate/2-oxoacid ferredoxin oxidoreductase subunit alpha